MKNKYRKSLWYSWIHGIINHKLKQSNQTKGEIKMAIKKKLTRAEKIRHGHYTTIVEALEQQGVKVLGKCKEGLVLENGNDEAVVLKVVVKKSVVPKSSIEPFVTLEQIEKEIEESKKDEE